MSGADVVVVGSGPNGLAAAVIMARAGLSVRVIEAADRIGGGTRTLELMEPGHVHDICSAVHPMALASPFFKDFELARRVAFEVPELSFAHPLDGGRAGLGYRNGTATSAALGPDGRAYGRLMAPLVRRLDDVTEFMTDQLLRIPAHPVAALAAGRRVLEQASPLHGLRFSGDEAPAMLAGIMAHAIQPLPSLSAAGTGLLLGAMAHAAGWPIPLGGSRAITDALALDFRAHGGEIITGTRVTSLEELRPASTILLDVAAPALERLAPGQLPPGYLRALRRFRFGNAACKVDYILSSPVPWLNPEVAKAGTVHLGGTWAEIARSEKEVASGRHPSNPYVLLSQPSVFDPTRAPAGRHILWTYCHVPAGSTRDMTEAVTAQIERFAPGFRDTVVASKVTTAEGLGDYNANYVGGDISAGAANFAQVLARPVLSAVPWRTPLPGVYLSSASVAPGPGVHGMAGFHAARYALRDIFGLSMPHLGLGT